MTPWHGIRRCLPAESRLRRGRTQATSGTSSAQVGVSPSRTTGAVGRFVFAVPRSNAWTTTFSTQMGHFITRRVPSEVGLDTRSGSVREPPRTHAGSALPEFARLSPRRVFAGSSERDRVSSSATKIKFGGSGAKSLRFLLRPCGQSARGGVRFAVYGSLPPNQSSVHFRTNPIVDRPCSDMVYPP